jgi:outer membrane protein, multidrug efflux system
MHEPFRVRPAPPENVESPAPPAKSDVAAALRLRPEILSLETALRASRSQVLSSKLQWAPSLSGFGNAAIYNYTGFTGDKYSWALGLQLDWVLYDGGLRDAQRRINNAQLRETEARLHLQRDTVSDEIANAEQGVVTRQRSLAASQKATTLAQKTLDLVRAQQGAGAATQLDLLTAQDSLVLAEVSVAQARFDLALARLTLDRVTGQFSQSTQF